MEFIAFREKLFEELKVIGREHPEGNLEFHDVYKNGKKWSGVTYRLPDSVLGPTIYAENYFSSRMQEQDIVEVAGLMFAHLQKMSKEKIMGEKNPLEKSNIFQHVFPSLLPRERNRELFDECVHLPFEDLEIFLKISIPEVSGVANVPLNYMRDSLKMDAEELFKVAVDSPEFKKEARVVPLMKGLDCEELGEEFSTDRIEINLKDLDVPIVCVTNSQQFYGAGAIFNTELMSKISEAFQDDLYIIPENIHGCLVAAKTFMPLQDAMKMTLHIKHLTENQETWLSGEVYSFDRDTRKIELAVALEEKKEVNKNAAKKEDMRR